MQYRDIVRPDRFMKRFEAFMEEHINRADENRRFEYNGFFEGIPYWRITYDRVFFRGWVGGRYCSICTSGWWNRPDVDKAALPPMSPETNEERRAREFGELWLLVTSFNKNIPVC